MTDWIQAVLTGLFTGIGVGIANWINDKHVHNYLERINMALNKVKEEIRVWPKNLK
jgi:hypothetical protein